MFIKLLKPLSFIQLWSFYLQYESLDFSILHSYHTQPHSFILRYENYTSEAKYICFVDDDDATFKELAPSVLSPLLKKYHVLYVSWITVFLYGYYKVYNKEMVVIWNPSIGKSCGIAVPSFYSQTQAHTWDNLVFGFGVRPVTRDPTVVSILSKVNMPWYVDVFTLSLGVWNVIPCSKLPRKSIELNTSTQVVIDRCIYWGASDMASTDAKCIVVSFDLITKEFKVVDLPDSLTNELKGAQVFVSKLRESLVVYESIYVNEANSCGVWVMEHDSSFKRLFTISTLVDKILGFSMSGEPIFETSEVINRVSTIDVYDPCSQQIKHLGIYGVQGSFFMGSYKQSLPLLDHSDLHIHSDDNLSE